MSVSVPSWFRPIKLRTLTRIVAQRQSYMPNPRYGLYLSHNGRRTVIGDQRIRLYTIRDIARIYGLEYQTIRRWYVTGLLPEPFIRHKHGGGEIAFYLRGQMHAICKTLNDLFGQGVFYFRLGRRTRRHIEMMHLGSDLNAAAFRANVTRRKLDNTFGVEWLDTPVNALPMVRPKRTREDAPH